MFEKLCSFNDLPSSDILDFFESTEKLKNRVLTSGWDAEQIKDPKLIVQIFFEASTRTRVSFELAAQRLNIKISHFQMDESTSLSKGESVLDSLRVFEALRPDLIIFRSKSNPDIDLFMNQTKIPFVCAGLGQNFHPTQALLDAFTMKEATGKRFEDMAVLFVGDTGTSRVVGSHLELSKKLGYKVLQCSDKAHSSKAMENIESLDLAAEQADFIIKLRTQKERGSHDLGASFKITSSHLQNKKKFLMHPGPFLRPEEFESGLPESSQSLIWKQKENGLYIRAMIFKKIWSTI